MKLFYQKILFAGVLFLSAHFSFGQGLDHSYQVMTINVDSFPRTQIVLEMLNGALVQGNEFQLFDEQKNPLEFAFRSLGNEEDILPGRLVYFLVDASPYTEGLPMENFKKAINESLDELIEPSDLVNIAYFNQLKEDATVLRPLDYSFTNNFEQLKNGVRNKITNALDDTTNSYYAFQAIKEALDVFEENIEPGDKHLIVISGAIKNSERTFTSDDLIEKANRDEVTVHTINYKVNNLFEPGVFDRMSLRTQGKSTNARTSTDIKNEIGNILESRAQSQGQVSSNPQYELEFISNDPADGQKHLLQLQYLNEPPINFPYTTPVAGGGQPSDGSGGLLGLFSGYTWIIVIVFGLLIASGYWYYNELQIRRQEEEEEEAELLAQQQEELRRLEGEKGQIVDELKEKNIRLQEQLRSKEQELAKRIDEIPTVVPIQKHDLKNTIISGGGGAPVFQVVAGAFNQNFRLNKPTMTIGRAPNNDIVVPEQTVSNKHATITIQNGSFFLNDLGSTNGTFVNGTRIESKILKSGDLIKLGAANCRFTI